MTEHKNMTGETESDMTGLRVKAILVSAGFVLLAGYGATYFMNQATNGEWSNPGGKFTAHYVHELQALGQSPPNAAKFARDDATDVVVERDVGAFIALLISGNDVRRHHTHPERPIRISFAGRQTIYILSRDSATPDQFWLEVVPDRDSPPTSTSPVVRQFNAPGLSAWLTQHGL